MTQKPPSFFYAAVRIFDLSLGEMLWSRRTIFMGLVVGLPVLIAIVVRLIVELSTSPMRANNVPLSGPMIFGLMIWALFIRFSVPVLGVFYGTSLIADEVEDKTITYLFSRPIPRGAVLVGKYLAYLACTVFVVLPSIVIVWLLVVPVGGTLAAGFIDLLKDLGLIAIGLAVYGAVFSWIGATFRRPLLAGLIFVFGWETMVMAIPGSLRRFSVAYYVQSMVPHAMPADSPVSILQTLFQEHLGVVESLIWLAIIGGGTLFLAARAVARREYVLEQ